MKLLLNSIFLFVVVVQASHSETKVEGNSMKIVEELMKEGYKKEDVETQISKLWDLGLELDNKDMIKQMLDVSQQIPPFFYRFVILH